MSNSTSLLLSKSVNHMTVTLLVIILLLTPNIVSTQTSPIPINPTASAINYSSKSNTNFFNGSETYTYPIGAISAGNLTHTVSVSNNTSGIRVGTLASDIGLGWHINAGGKITRSIRGLNDGDNKTGEGWWKRSQQGLGLPTSREIADGEKDGAPDMYHVNAGNLNFSFFYDENDDVHTIPKSNIQVIRYPGDQHGYGNDARAFKIVDGLGNVYMFGWEDDNIEFMETLAPGSDLIGKCGGDKMDIISGWFLYLIRSHDSRDRIDFTYSKSGYEYYSLAGQHKYKGTNGEDEYKFQGNDDYVDHVFNLFVVKSCRLDKIETSYESFDFKYGNLREDLGQNPFYVTRCGQDVFHTLKSRELDAIEFSDKFGNICVSHEFDLEYFTDNTGVVQTFGWNVPDWTFKRLCLNSITKKECNTSNQDLKTTFSYSNGSFFPNCLSMAIDHWGYCNSAFTNPKELIPPTTHGNYSYGTANRDPDFIGTLHGVLTKVTFPTGGYIQYQHELNEAEICESGNCVNKPIGGFRVKKKITSDGINFSNNIVENFEYNKFNNTNESSGQLHFGFPEYARSFWEGTYFYFQPDFPLQNYFGSHINYCEVRKFQSDLGKTEYSFENLPTTPSNKFAKPPAQYTNAVGFMTNQELFEEGHTTVLSGNLQVRKNDVLSNMTTAKVVGKMHAKVGNWANNASRTEYASTEYGVYTGLQRMESSTATRDGLSTTTTNGFDNSDQVFMPIWQEYTNSDGKIYRSEKSYSGNSLMWAEGAVQDELLFRNIRDLPWKTISKVDGVIIDGNYTKYKEFGTGQESLLKPYKEYRAERSWDDSGNIYPSVSNMWELQKTFLEYNPEGRLKKSSVPGFSPQTDYVYSTDNKRLISVWFNNKKTRFGYYGDSKILNWKENAGGLRTTYFYDGQGRLEKTLDNCSGVFTEYDYVFGNSINSPDDYVETTQDFTNNNVSHANCPVTTLKQRAYVDGLGRNVQSVMLGQHPDGSSDIIRAKSYDKYGRSDKNYLPFTSNGSGGYVAPSSSWGYALKSYEASPLSRLENLNPPGELLGNTISYGTNVATDNVKKIGSQNPYSVNTLYKLMSTDPEGNKTISFTDKMGRTILSRKESNDGTKYIDTYYEYDPKGRLTCVYPAVPHDIDGQIMQFISKKLLFEYTYYPDDKEKTVKLPDSDYKEYRYNARGLIAATQDANQRADGEWLISHYDTDNRLFASWIFTGTVPANETFNNLTTSSADTQLSDLEYHDSGVEINQIKREQTRVLGKNQWLIQDHFYDDCGRLDHTKFNNHLEFNSLDGTSTGSRVDYKYDQTNTVIETQLKQLGDYQTYDFKQRDIKDHTGRVVGHEINWNNEGWKSQSETSHNEREEVVQSKLGKSAGNWLQTVDYAYKDWGALHTINEGANLGNLNSIAACGDLPTSGSNPDLFSLKLNYDNNAVKDGNISSLEYAVAGRKKEQQSFVYDYLNRLTINLHQNFDAFYTYDDRGKIKTLTRYGLQQGEDGCFSSKLIDNLTYNYLGTCNQLQSVNDAVSPCPTMGVITTGGGNPGIYSTIESLYAVSEIEPTGTTNYTAGDMVKFDAGFSVDVSSSGGTFIAENEDCITDEINLILEEGNTPSAGFIERGGTYLYDANGNMTYDPNKLVTYIYNHLNLVEEIIWDDGRSIDLIYDATGNLLERRVIPDLDPMPPAILIDQTDYLGPIELFNHYLESIYHDSGRLSFDEYNTGTLDYKEEFNLLDHLGNTRIVFSDLDGNGSIDLTQDPTTTEILQENHYYPYGMRMTGPWLEDIHATESYQYNGMEYVNDHNLGLNMTTYRNLDPTLGIWTSVDPKAEANQNFSPYTSMASNPIAYADPDGDLPILAVMAIYGAVNLGINAIQGNVNSVGDGLLYFGIGAANGALSTISPLKLPFGESGFGLSLAPQIAIGTDGAGIGFNATLGYQGVKGLNVGFNFGGTFYTSALGTGQTGFEERFGFGIGYKGDNFKAIASTTFFSSGETSQRTGLINLGYKDLNLKVSNDLFGDGGDRFRTAAIHMGYKDYTLGVNMFTGDPGLDGRDKTFIGGDPNGTYIESNGNDPDKYRFGGLFLGYKGYRVGANSEGIRNLFQNKIAHDRLTGSPHFKVLNNNWSPYFGHYSSNPYTLW